MKKVKLIHKDNCIGCGICVNLCPEVFRIVDGKAVIHVQHVPKEAEASCQQAIDKCPLGSIMWA